LVVNTLLLVCYCGGTKVWRGTDQARRRVRRRRGDVPKAGVAEVPAGRGGALALVAVGGGTRAWRLPAPAATTPSPEESGVARSTSAGRLYLSRGLAGQLRRCGAGARVRDKGAAVWATRGNPKVTRVRCGACGAGNVGPQMMEDTGLIWRSRAVGSWVSERKFIFAAIWVFGSWVSERK
jgi:hypothetical protein